MPYKNVYEDIEKDRKGLQSQRRQLKQSNKVIKHRLSKQPRSVSSKPTSRRRGRGSLFESFKNVEKNLSKISKQEKELSEYEQQVKQYQQEGYKVEKKDDGLIFSKKTKPKTRSRSVKESESGFKKRVSRGNVEKQLGISESIYDDLMWNLAGGKSSVTSGQWKAKITEDNNIQYYKKDTTKSTKTNPRYNKLSTVYKKLTQQMKALKKGGLNSVEKKIYDMYKQQRGQVKIKMMQTPAQKTTSKTKWVKPTTTILKYEVKTPGGTKVFDTKKQAQIFIDENFVEREGGATGVVNFDTTKALTGYTPLKEAVLDDIGVKSTVVSQPRKQYISTGTTWQGSPSSVSGTWSRESMIAAGITPSSVPSGESLRYGFSGSQLERGKIVQKIEQDAKKEAMASVKEDYDVFKNFKLEHLAGVFVPSIRSKSYGKWWTEFGQEVASTVFTDPLSQLEMTGSALSGDWNRAGQIQERSEQDYERIWRKGDILGGAGRIMSSTPGIVATAYAGGAGIGALKQSTATVAGYNIGNIVEKGMVVGGTAITGYGGYKTVAEGGDLGRYLGSVALGAAVAFPAYKAGYVKGSGVMQRYQSTARIEDLPVSSYDKTLMRIQQKYGLKAMDKSLRLNAPKLKQPYDILNLRTFDKNRADILLNMIKSEQRVFGGRPVIGGSTSTKMQLGSGFRTGKPFSKYLQRYTSWRMSKYGGNIPVSKGMSWAKGRVNPLDIAPGDIDFYLRSGRYPSYSGLKRVGSGHVFDVHAYPSESVYGMRLPDIRYSGKSYMMGYKSQLTTSGNLKFPSKNVDVRLMSVKEQFYRKGISVLPGESKFTGYRTYKDMADFLDIGRVLSKKNTGFRQSFEYFKNPLKRIKTPTTGERFLARVKGVSPSRVVTQKFGSPGIGTRLAKTLGVPSKPISVGYPSGGYPSYGSPTYGFGSMGYLVQSSTGYKKSLKDIYKTPSKGYRDKKVDYVDKTFDRVNKSYTKRDMSYNPVSSMSYKPKIDKYISKRGYTKQKTVLKPNMTLRDIGYKKQKYDYKNLPYSPKPPSYIPSFPKQKKKPPAIPDFDKQVKRFMSEKQLLSSKYRFRKFKIPKLEKLFKGGSVF